MSNDIKPKSFIKKTEETSAENLFVLSRTRKIEEQDIFQPEWKFVNELYLLTQDESWINKALVTIVNSIFYQKAGYFIISRRKMRTLLKNDKNWPKAIGLRDENYKEIVQELAQRQIAEVVKKFDNKVWVWRAIHPDLLGLLNFDMETKKEAVMQFAEIYNDSDELDEGTSEGTTQGTTQGNHPSPPMKKQKKTDFLEGKVEGTTRGNQEEELELELELEAEQERGRELDNKKTGGVPTPHARAPGFVPPLEQTALEKLFEEIKKYKKLDHSYSIHQFYKELLPYKDQPLSQLFQDFLKLYPQTYR